MVNGWKITAIIFICLWITTMFTVIYIMKTGIDILEQEDSCAYDVCSEFESYYYDPNLRVCYCVENGEIVKEMKLEE